MEHDAGALKRTIERRKLYAEIGCIVDPTIPRLRDKTVEACLGCIAWATIQNNIELALHVPPNNNRQSPVM